MEEDGTAPHEGLQVKVIFFPGKEGRELGQKLGLSPRPFYRGFGLLYGAVSRFTGHCLSLLILLFPLVI